MASTATMFIAVQCCQCSMMQVKQKKKKNSNKWTCAVCNQKQSVRKVFAQGYMARDLRQFVQSFNFNFTFPQSDHQTLSQQDTPNKKLKLNADGDGDGSQSAAPSGEGSPSNQLYKPPFLSSQYQDEKELKNRPAMTNAASKWSKYMTQDDKEPRTRQAATASASASKWQEYMTHDDEERAPSASAGAIDDDKELKNLSAMTNAASKWSKYMTQDDMGPRTRRAATASASASKWHEYMTQDDEEQSQATMAKGALTQDDIRRRCCQDVKAASDKEFDNHWSTMGKTTSKWNNYLRQRQEDGDDLKPVIGIESADHIGDWSNAIFETITQDQRVEDDDVHPDFI